MIGEIHRSSEYSQEMILRSIMILHNNGDRFQLDPCFNKGTMYGSLMHPILKFDIKPIVQGVQKGDFKKIDLIDDTVHSIVADPPFIIGDDEIMSPKYGSYESLAILQSEINGLLVECTRIIKRDGLLVIKCQDIIHDRRKYFVSYFIQNQLFDLGWNQIDEYVKVNKSRPHNSSNQVSYASRSYHSKFLVFRFRRGRRKYRIS